MTDEAALYRLHLSGPVSYWLFKAGIRTIQQLRHYSEEQLLALPGFDTACLQEVRAQLARWDAHQQQGTARPDTPRVSARRKPETRLFAAAPLDQLRAQGKAQEQAISALYQQGKTPRQIAQETGLSRQRVYQYLKRLDCSPNPDVRNGLIVAAHNLGLTPRQIAEDLDISPPTVYHCLHSQGLTPHKPAPRPSLREAVLERYQQGQTPRQIAEALGVTVGGVHWHLKRRNRAVLAEEPH